MKRTLLTLIALFGLFAYALWGQSGKENRPQYSKSGALMLPSGYRGWRFITSGLGMTYGPPGIAGQPGNPNFDNVFVQDIAYRAFLRSGSWPDKTVLVVEARSSDSKASINQGGHFQDKLIRVEAHVKDASRGGWAFYIFEPGVAESPILPRTANCYSCHEQHGAVESTFVQFYPTLIPAAIEHATFRK